MDGLRMCNLSPCIIFKWNCINISRTFEPLFRKEVSGGSYFSSPAPTVFMICKYISHQLFWSYCEGFNSHKKWTCFWMYFLKVLRKEPAFVWPVFHPAENIYMVSTHLHKQAQNDSATSSVGHWPPPPAGITDPPTGGVPVDRLTLLRAVDKEGNTPVGHSLWSIFYPFTFKFDYTYSEIQVFKILNFFSCAHECDGFMHQE